MNGVASHAGTTDKVYHLYKYTDVLSPQIAVLAADSIRSLNQSGVKVSDG